MFCWWVSLPFHFIHLFHKDLLSAYYVQGSPLGTGDSPDPILLDNSQQLTEVYPCQREWVP